MTPYAEIAETVVRNIVDTPDDARVEVIEKGRTILVHVTTAPGENGMVVGKGGKIIAALKTILVASAMSKNDRRRIHVEVGDGGPQE